MRLAVVATGLLACAGCRQVFGLDEPVPQGPVDARGESDAEDAPIDVAPVLGEQVRAITPDPAKVAGGPFSKFPLLVSIDAPWLRDTLHGGDVARADGFDIYFADDQIGTGRLAHEVERYDPATGTLL